MVVGVFVDRALQVLCTVKLVRHIWLWDIELGRRHEVILLD